MPNTQSFVARNIKDLVEAYKKAQRDSLYILPECCEQPYSVTMELYREIVNDLNIKKKIFIFDSENKELFTIMFDTFHLEQKYLSLIISKISNDKIRVV